MRIGHAALSELIRKSLRSTGVPSGVADIEAEVMAEADLLGVPSHGVRMLPLLLAGLRDGRVAANPELKMIRERGAACVLDGANGPGRFVSVRAMDQAVTRARQHGVGVCVATRLTHWGRAHAYASRAARSGMVGICVTNAIPNMVAWGSSRPLLANNPLAIAVPRGLDGEPLVLDIAMSQAAVGKIGTFLREGRQVPANWGLDAAGKPSKEPAEILASGRVLPFGEHKGIGLAFMLELLTGPLADGLLSFEVARADPSGLDPGSTKLFIALNVEAFTDSGRFAKRVEELIAWLRSVEPGLAITLPGERGWQTRTNYLAEGIPIHPEIVSQLEAAGIRLDELPEIRD